MASNSVECRHGQPTLSVQQRPAYSQKVFDLNYRADLNSSATIEKTSEKVKNIVDGACASARSFAFWRGLLFSVFPIFDWLRHYEIGFLLPDVLAGVTVGIMHVSVGMANAIVAAVPPISGLYVSFFASLFYVAMGTSKHIVLGGDAVISILVGDVVRRVLVNQDTGHYSKNDGTIVKHDPIVAGSLDIVNPIVDPTYEFEPDAQYTNLQIATAISFTVGLYQICMGIGRLGSLSIYLSDTMLSGFTLGVSVHLFASQLGNLLGITVPTFMPPFKILRVVIYLVKHIKRANLATVVISAASIFALTFVKVIQFKCFPSIVVPLPVELCVIIGSLVASYTLDLKGYYGVTIIGYVPTGLPSPSLPAFTLIPDLLWDGLVIAVICYTLTLSFALMFAKKYEYKIKSSQELIALGNSNMLSSFFSCYPSCAAMTRCLTAEAVGGKTQIVGVVSSGLIFIVLLFVGPIFEYLPTCVLSAIMVVVLKSMLNYVGHLSKAYQMSITEASIWLVTFCTVIIWDIGVGLAVGLFYSMIIVLFRTRNPYSCSLGKIEGLDIYLDTSKYKYINEERGIKIFHYESFLYFVNKDDFKEQLYRKVGVDPELRSTQNFYANLRIAMQMDEESKLNSCYVTASKYGTLDSGTLDALEKGDSLSSTDRMHLIEDSEDITAKPLQTSSPIEVPKVGGGWMYNNNLADVTNLHHIIIDASNWSYIDMAGIDTLHQIISSYEKLGITVYIAGCQGGATVADKFERSNFHQKLKNHVIFPTIHDAVAYARMEQHKISSTHSFLHHNTRN